MTDEVKKLMEQATEAAEVPFEPPLLGKTYLAKMRRDVLAQTRFFREMDARGLRISGGEAVCANLLRAIDNYVRVVTAKQTDPEPSPEEWWASVLEEASKRSE